jgi:predicted  nucleic acid-binding Zn-ribbon protein
MPDKVTELKYNRVNWRNGNEGSTAISADNLNKMDKGISDVTAAVNDLDNEVYKVHTELLSSKIELESTDTVLNNKIVEETTNINNRIDALNTNVGNKADTVEVSALQTKVNTLSTNIDSVSSKATANENAIKNLQDTVNNLSPDVDGGVIE